MKDKWRVVHITPTGETSTRHPTKTDAKRSAKAWKNYRHTHKMKGRTRLEKIPKYAQY